MGAFAGRYWAVPGRQPGDTGALAACPGAGPEGDLLGVPAACPAGELWEGPAASVAAGSGTPDGPGAPAEAGELPDAGVAGIPAEVPGEVGELPCGPGADPRSAGEAGIPAAGEHPGVAGSAVVPVGRVDLHTQERWAAAELRAWEPE